LLGEVKMENSKEDLEVEDLFITFTELYEIAAKTKDYTLCLILKEEMRKVLSDNGLIFQVNYSPRHRFEV
jgi:hypothetical protein